MGSSVFRDVAVGVVGKTVVDCDTFVEARSVVDVASEVAKVVVVLTVSASFDVEGDGVVVVTGPCSNFHEKCWNRPYLTSAENGSFVRVPLSLTV